ncbi:hypothetical protein M3Y99_00149200 [Aphelenchoides fujianensis]|nr:hypothetical protein M3Y99_00149200 [Aphelenchoides fujianensis]
MSMEQVIALAEIAVVCLLFGSIYVPIKRFRPGDGFFSQFMMSLGIFAVGFGIFAATGFGRFFPLAMVGGVLIGVGNLVAIPIIQELGLALAILLFNVTSCVVNYAVGTFGLFGTRARRPAVFWLSLVGMLLVVVGGVLISFVKTKPSELMAELERLSPNRASAVLPSLVPSTDDCSLERGEAKPKTNCLKNFRKGIALVFALIAGTLYGVVQVPIIAIEDNPALYPDAPKDGLHFCFSLYCGLFLVSSASFLVYAGVKKNSPSINPSVALPSFCSGLMWAAGMCLTIVCTQHLSQAVAGPITSMVPGCVATLWSVHYFREVPMGRNLLLLWGGIAVTVGGAVCIGVSR